MVENIDKQLTKVINEPNKEKAQNAKNMQNNIDLCKEFITKYFISTNSEYDWLAKQFNKENVEKLLEDFYGKDIDMRFEKKEEILYENTLGYKIKHPIYVALNKIGIYDFIKRVLKRGE